MKIIAENKKQFERLESKLNRLFLDHTKIKGVAESKFVTDFIIITDSYKDLSMFFKNEDVRRITYEDNTLSIALSDCVVELKSGKEKPKYVVDISNDER